MVDEAKHGPDVTPQPVRERRPGSVVAVVVLVWLQVVTNAFLGWLLLQIAQEDASHGREVPGLVYVTGYVSLIAAVLLAVCAVLLITRRSIWPRYAVIGFQLLSIGLWGLGLVQAGEIDISGVPPVIPVIVLILLAREEMEDWYDGSPHKR
ncbi:hypothetical protein ACTWP5_17840 [Streptomyces sp. 4N509B]|uniref:hypothetical protein n=1 Tax=Streptomyces sp. 4N509B TaxID=3457413 RepID=UPI003FCF412C